MAQAEANRGSALPSYIILRARTKVNEILAAIQVQIYGLVGNLPNYFAYLAEVFGHFAKKC